MDKTTAKYYQLYFERVTPDELIAMCENPLKKYLEILPPGPILEIGIGVGSDTLYFATQGKNVVCIEKEEEIIKQFENRIRIYSKTQNKKLDVTLLQQEYPNINLPNQHYACIIVSNLLHFFRYDETKINIEKIKSLLMPGGLIYIKAHSIQHPFASRKKGYTSFKHYFTENELLSLFHSDFQVLYSGIKTFHPPQIEKEIKWNWIEWFWFEFHFGKDNTKIEELVRDNPIDDPEISAEIIVRHLNNL